jgi:7-keto-8-aminopelargonate synthetase-like enzyme
VHELGLKTPNITGFPIIEIPLADAGDLSAVGDFLFDQGIYVTLAAYPLVPRDQVGFRIQVTAANHDDEIEELTQALKGVAGRFELQRESQTPSTSAAVGAEGGIPTQKPAPR